VTVRTNELAAVNLSMSENTIFIEFHEALAKLSHSQDFINDNRERKLTLLTELVSRLLNAGRVSVWQLNTARNQITSEILFVAKPGSTTGTVDTTSSVLNSTDNPAYFEALTTARVIDASSARSDPRTQAFTNGYFDVLDIHSLLDAPIFDGSRLSGVVCIESHTLRRWTLPEISFVIAIADTISLINTHDNWQRSQRQLDYVTHYDSLTGLPNLQSIRERLTQLIRKSRTDDQRRITLIWIDLDRLKTVNDGLGATAGNMIIAEIANRLRSLYVKGRDKLARIGGDEFALLLRNAESDCAVSDALQRIQSCISEPIQVANRAVSMTASVGVCHYPVDGQDGEALLRSGETAMYHAKSSGRAQIQYFNADIDTSARSRFVLESELRNAIRERQLEVYYQPIMDTKTGRFVSNEALVRWHHPERGWLSPIEFLDVARNAGLMLELGNAVIERVCEHRREAARRKQPMAPTAVNLASEQVLDDQLAHKIGKTLRQYGVSGNELHFEVTEDAIKGDSNTLKTSLNALVALGCQLSIDDFGTGYSSLSRLKHLPFSKLKIDRSFIQDIPADKDDCAITLSILGLARGLGMQVVAEGVETEAHKHWLEAEGCDHLQGYLFSRPLPFEQLLQSFPVAADALS
tara:strand:+ start:10307 stop:12214 length:1908 start_codon:yes stop_codon:yes gene_type:complete